ncbi:magnesium transporter CorA family protein [Candidatus Woesearchaeota archaeon]|nr:magnesium transporter CorA family protein [Candidatus Woesearchaeota archaeon]
MFEVLKREKAGFTAVTKLVKGCWVNCVNPSGDELNYFRSLLGVPEDFLASVQDPEEIPFIERHDNRLLVLVRVPVKVSDDVPYRTVPLGLVLSKDFFASLCFDENDALQKFRSDAYEFSGLQPLLKMLYSVARTFLSHLKEINREIYSTEKDLEKSTRNKDLLELFALEKSLVYFSMAIANNRLVLEKLGRIVPKKDKDLFDDVGQEFKQAAGMAKIYSITLTVMMDTFGSVISNNLNVVIKALTSITIILMIPTLVASVYGMNVELPFQHSPHAFLIILVGSVLLSLLGVIVFWKRALF